jgi:hypothetical protein
MNARIIVAILLLALGVVGLGYQGITYTTRERVVDAGPLKVDAEKKHSISLLPIAAGLLVAGGVVLLLVGRRKPIS